MDDTGPGRLLEAQHQDIDRDALALMEQRGNQETLDRMLALLRLHIYIEEEILFPAVATPALAMPVYILQYEHARIWRFLDNLQNSAEQTQASSEALAEDCRRLFKIFEMHNPKEEDLIYEAAERVAEADPEDKLLTAIKTAQFPDRWVCMGQRENFGPPPDAPPWEPPLLPRPVSIS